MLYYNLKYIVTYIRTKQESKRVSYYNKLKSIVPAIEQKMNLEHRYIKW